MTGSGAQQRSFLAPSFRIEIDGRDTGRAVISDVLEVSFTDDLKALDSFEFSLLDWDPVNLAPVYSSPWDDNGQLRKVPGTERAVPNFEPGRQVNLYLGYVEDGELPLIMQGEVVSLAPSFPAAGAPTCRVRALDSFQLGLQRTQVAGNFSGTPRDVVDQLCQQNDVDVSWDEVTEEGASRKRVEVDGTLFEEIAGRAEGYSMAMVTVPPTSAKQRPALRLAVVSGAGGDLVAEFRWGRSLLSFTPVLSAAGQVAEVVVRGADPSAKGAERAIEVSKTWSDIGLAASAIGLAGKADLDTAVRRTKDILKPDRITSRADAEKAATRRLRELAKSLITGSGSSVGLPELRAGKKVQLTGLGARFDGLYRLTKTTHTIGGSGYTTTFEASKEVLR